MTRAAVLIPDLPLEKQSTEPEQYWTKIEQSFVGERIRSLLQLSPSLMRSQVQDLSEHVPAKRLACELASTIYLAVDTPESNSLDSVIRLWESLELPLRKAVRDAFQERFGAPIKSVLGHRLPAHLKAVLSW